MSIYDPFIFMESGRTTLSKSSENCSSYTCVPGTLVSNDPLHSGGENKKEGFSFLKPEGKKNGFVGFLLSHAML